MTVWTIGSKHGFPITIECEHFLTAAVICARVGKGKYNIQPSRIHNHCMPHFQSPQGINDWFIKTFNTSLPKATQACNKQDLINGLTSALPIGMSRRKILNHVTRNNPNLNIDRDTINAEESGNKPEVCESFWTLGKSLDKAYGSAQPI